MAALKPPGRYITLSEAYESSPGTQYCVIGICVDYLPPARSRGTDHTIKFTLSDPGWFAGSGMNFRFFHQSQEGLPAIQNTGDIIILRNLTTRSFGSSPFGISHQATFWYVLSGSSVLESTCPNGTDIKYVKSSGKYNAEPLNLQEIQYAKALAGSSDPVSFKMPAKATALQIEGIIRENGGTPPVRKDKWRLLKDLDLDKHNSAKFSDGQPAFADLFGEVRRMFAGQYSCVDVYLTDYTSNSRLYDYEYSSQAREGDEYGYVANAKSWQGPWGKMTIKVFLWDAHGMFMKTSVKEKMFVLIKNCHIKVDPNGSKLEAVCRGDRDNPSKVNVTIFDPADIANDERFQSLLERRRIYEKTAVKQGLPFEISLQRTKTKHDLLEPVKPAKISKSKRKKLKKLAEQKATAGLGKSTNTPNEHIRCNNVEIPISPIDKILGSDLLKRTTQVGNELILPFQNAAYKCTVRVVDFYPADITQFAVPYEEIVTKPASFDMDCDDVIEARDVSISTARSFRNHVRWEWRFMLVVEDATSSVARTGAQIPIMVAGQHGDCLLKEDACDLAQNPEILSRMTEKLFILWGDLQERKESNLLVDVTDEERSQSQRPFECLIQEYGALVESAGNESANVHEYKRMFQLFGTTIM